MRCTNKCTILAALLALCWLQVSAKEALNKTEEFVATDEWQVVKEGQGIPKGLHVRINLQTGVKEAKLLDESERATAVQQAREETGTPALGLEHVAEQVEDALKKHRSYAELRKDFKEFQKNFRTDSELIAQLLQQFGNFSKIPLETEFKAKLNNLENLEYLLHQIDNALVFIELGGLEDLLLPIVVNDTNKELKICAMRVLGALTGNNPAAQIKVFERNFGSQLAQILMTSTNSMEVSSALHAFGSLLRKFPLAQQRILSTSGTQALVRVLGSEDVELRHKAKAVTLISDLLLEKRLVQLAGQETPKAASTVAQYNLIDLESWLQAQGYCNTLETVLTKDFVQLLDQPEAVEQFTVALETSDNLCLAQWSQSAALRHVLLTVRNRYAHSQDEYRLELSQALAKLCERFFDKQNHTEL